MIEKVFDHGSGKPLYLLSLASSQRPMQLVCGADDVLSFSFDAVKNGLGQ